MPDEARENTSEGEELMPSIHRVIHYSGLDYNEVLKLPCDVFLLMVKNDYMDELNSTQEGREYLEKCKRLNTTEMDFSALRDFQASRGGI